MMLYSKPPERAIKAKTKIDKQGCDSVSGSQNMKIKKTGKVHPSPTSSDGNALSVLKLLPAAILAVASVLSVEEREVLAYMITRSMDTAIQKTKKRNHKLFPQFDCDCFDCYTCYWFRWDSSPNRDLIHQVIEAFEDHFSNDDKSSTNAPTPTNKQKLQDPILPDSTQQDKAEQRNLGFPNAAAINHKGLARKVLPDVLGILNSRLWHLWSPNV